MLEYAEYGIEKIANAQALMYEGDLQQTINCIEQVLGIEPLNIEALYMTAVCRRHLKQYDEALIDLILPYAKIIDAPFEPSCPNFHKTKRAVRTVSSEQARQPINRRRVDHWRNFRP